jgi:hypothetical protein
MMMMMMMMMMMEVTYAQSGCNALLKSLPVFGIVAVGPFEAGCHATLRV